ncbi:hypothetical protein EDB89DRAFT_2080832 [Lactarius sanguifluus]|nr:hypothetical protein EDB89DRAFT_2080832 [Lactarius sanguifluus]
MARRPHHVRAEGGARWHARPPCRPWPLPLRAEGVQKGTPPPSLSLSPPAPPISPVRAASFARKGGARGYAATVASPRCPRAPCPRGKGAHDGMPPPPRLCGRGNTRSLRRPLPVAPGPPFPPVRAASFAQKGGARGHAAAAASPHCPRSPCPRGEGAARWHAAPASFARKGTRGHAAPLSPLPPPYSLSAPSRSRGSGAHDARAASPSPVAAPPRSRGGGLHEGTPPPLQSPLPLRVPLSAPRQFVRKGGARRRRRPVLARRGCTRAHTPSPVATPPRSHGSGAHDAAAASPSPVAAPPRSRGGGVHEGTPPPLRSPLPLRVPLSAPRQFGRKGCARASRLAQPTVRCGKGKRGRRHPHRARKGARKGELSPPAPTRRTAGPAVPARALTSLPVFARHSTT